MNMSLILSACITSYPAVIPLMDLWRVSSVLFCLLMVNKRWPPLHLVRSKNKKRIFGSFPDHDKLGSKGVKQWGGLSDYCISSLSSCFPGRNNRLKRQFWVGGARCVFLGDFPQKKERARTISFLNIWCKISIVFPYHRRAKVVLF